MKILITGGAGFIGSNLARMLLETPEVDEVRILDDLSTGHRFNLDGLDLRFSEGTILDPDAVRAAVDGVDSVVHLAAIPSVPRSIADPVRSHAANATGTLVLLEAVRAAGVPHVVVASSSSVYGANPAMPKNEFDWTRPMSPYAVSKQATEGYALAYQHSYGLRTLALRFFNVYGPRQAADHAYAAVIPRFLDAALDGRPVQIYGDGRQSRDFTYVDTVCAVIRQAVLRGVHSPDPVNLAYGSRTSLLGLLDAIEHRIGHPVGREHRDPRAGDVSASQADDSRVRQLFPDVHPIGLEDGLAATIAWFQDMAREENPI